MTASSARLLAIGTVSLFLWTSLPALGQGIPSDLQIIGMAGGLEPTTENTTVHITADGQGTFSRFVPGEPTTTGVESSSFTLTTTELEQLWQAIQANDFFNLSAEHVNEEISDRTFAELIVTANGATHTVTTQNIAVDAFDTIISTINGLTPGEDDLVYDTTEAFTFDPIDVCERPGKRETTALSKGSKDREDYTTTAASAVGNTSAFDFTSTLNGEAHPGTAAAYRMTLREAVERGIVTLSGKGEEFFGDLVSISIDNSGNGTSDRLDLSLYLEFWGPKASASTARVVEEAIERIWGKKTTTGGKAFSVDVHTRVSPGGSNPPGTSGYHQIKLVESGTSTVSGLGTTFELNAGVGSGTWRTTGRLLNEMYAHEAGHLLALPDRYDDYRKQSDGTWKLRGSEKTLTSEELAAEIIYQFPGFTEATLKTWLDKARRITPAKAGSENDIMGDKSKSPVQSDIDALAAQAGVIVEVRPGDILVNKNGSQQNFTITRSEDVFVHPGGGKTLAGLYVACLDRWDDTPTEGVMFDLAPSLSEWRGIESAQVLQQLVDYTDEQERFCDGDLPAQWAIWRVTDNHLIGDVDAEAYLKEANVALGRRLLDFPRMSNPSPNDQTTNTLLPPQLFVPEIAVSPRDFVRAGERVALSASVQTPSLEGVSMAFSWSLEGPDGSTAVLSNEQGETTSFTPNARGFYQVQLQVTQTGGVSGSGLVTATEVIASVDTRAVVFETGFQRPSILWATSPDNPWALTNETSNTGASSITSAIIDDGVTTGLRAIFEQATSGPISFAYKVSSEPEFDVLWFFVDEEAQGSWSGDVDWSIFSMDLGAGEHTASWLYIKDRSGSGGADRVWLDDVFFSVDATFTAVEDPLDDGLPAAYQLFQNYPNPFNPTTTLSYTIPEPQHVSLVIYDELGRQVAVLVEEQVDAGHHRVLFDARGLSNGIYHYELRAGSFRERKSMILFW